MTGKSEMTNRLLAQKLKIEYIHSLAKLEGCNVTLLETEDICEGRNNEYVSIKDLCVIDNLKVAWKFYLDMKVNSEIDLAFLLAINKRVSHNESFDWGVLRNGNVVIMGTNYRPKLPVENEIREEFSVILLIENPVLRALKLFIWMCRRQLFWDGNKRTASICCNKVLLDNNCGFMIIKEENLVRFNELLSEFYETNIDEIILTFLSETCLANMNS